MPTEIWPNEGRKVKGNGKQMRNPWMILAAWLLALVIPACVMAEGETHVVILGTSDMHGNIWG